MHARHADAADRDAVADERDCGGGGDGGVARVRAPRLLRGIGASRREACD